MTLFRLMASLFVLALGATTTSAAPSKALCVVCVVKEGAKEEEPVKSVRTYNGVEYYFCSEKCVAAFDADPAAYVPPELPYPAPKFAVKQLTGEAVALDSLRGKVTLLDFWATWCAPCLKSMPELQALHVKYGKRGFGVLGVSIDEGDPAKVTPKVKKFVAAKKISYPIAIDDDMKPAWEAYRVKAVPAAFLIDREGRVVAQWTGAAPSRAELERKIEGLLRAY